MNICVFCSSSNALEKCYIDHAKQLGKLLGEGKHCLVYGGANVGLMEPLALSVKESGSKVIGIIPQKIHENKLSSALPDDLIITDTMDERKKMMRDKSDAFIALPGGFGTLEEILEVITLKQLDYHQKPIVILNTNGFFNALIDQFEKSYEEHFAKESYKNLFIIVNTPNEALSYIENYRHTN